jgi:hypothetical protein
MGIVQITKIKAAISDGAFGRMFLNSFTLNVILKEHRTGTSTFRERDKKSKSFLSERRSFHSMHSRTPSPPFPFRQRKNMRRTNVSLSGNPLTRGS